MIGFEQFIGLTGPEDTELDQWAMRVLNELSKEPDPIGEYAKTGI